jgi:hypothetical protein
MGLVEPATKASKFVGTGLKVINVFGRAAPFPYVAVQVNVVGVSVSVQ